MGGLLRLLAVPLRQDVVTFYALPSALPELEPAVKDWRWKVSHKWPADAKKMWNDLGEAKEGTMKARIYGLGTRLLSSIPEEEFFLKAVSVKTAEAELLVPDFLDQQVTMEKLAQLCQDKIPFHKRWRTLSIACLPLSTAAGLLPGPNVFLLYNAFRVYSHHLALSHAIHLSSLLEKGVVRTGISTELSEACTNWDRKHLLPDAVLDGLANRLGSGTGGDLWAHLDRARMQLAKREAEANNAK